MMHFGYKIALNYKNAIFPQKILFGSGLKKAHIWISRLFWQYKVKISGNQGPKFIQNFCQKTRIVKLF